ncbi:MAG: DHH family phosphoesterase [Thermodesulfobacteriota bacterium]
MYDKRSVIKTGKTVSKSLSSVERYRRLLEVAGPEDTLGIIVNADPDALASALALKRLFWRRLKKIVICRINVIKRSDNLTMVRSLQIDHHYINKIDIKKISKWAIIDSQPHHDPRYSKFRFDIIIDHHPVAKRFDAEYVDIRPEYGSTSTIMTQYLKSAGIKPSARLATALFYGIKTDTDNFARPTTDYDIKAFRYLYQYANLNMVKKIESAVLTKKSLTFFRKAIDNLVFSKDRAVINMGEVKDPDNLVIIADFFVKMAEVTWSIVYGTYGRKLIIIIRNAGFRYNAGNMASRLFGELGNAGGHRDAARAEIKINSLEDAGYSEDNLGFFIHDKIDNYKAR